MKFAPDAERFLALGSERLVVLASLLAARGLPYSVIRSGGSRHLMLRMGSGAPRLALAAHYDRVEGSPGVLDNSCACLQLIEFAARTLDRHVSQPGKSPALLILFTDGEENPGVEGVAAQGAFSLARALSAARLPGSAAQMPPVLVFDVTGRGDRLVLSSAPAVLLNRRGLGESPLARGHLRLIDLARSSALDARLAAPLSLELPWSDDLGLVLGGIPALTVSLLPEAEARALPKVRPKTWSFLHCPDDGPALAQERSFGIMAAFLDALAQRC